MKFVNEYTGKSYATLAECEASEKAFLEKNRENINDKVERFLSLDIQGAIRYCEKEITAADRDNVILALKTAYPYSSVDEIAGKLPGYISEENRVLRYLWWYAKYPFIEQLIKAEFLVDPIIRKISGFWDGYRIDLGKVFHKGTTLQEITGLKHYMIPFVKNFDSWSEYTETVKMLKKIAKGKEDCELWKSLCAGLNVTRIREVKYLLNNGYFTLKTLKNYLDRLDMYQAVSKYDGVLLTRRYVSNCKRLKIEPTFDSPSIKRDVDVTDREVRKISDQILNEKIAKIMQGYKNLEYENEKFKVIVPKDNYDIIREGQKMHNCVGSYGRWNIISGRSKVLFVRRKSDPDTPYITMDLRGGIVDQYLTAYNRQPDAEALEFKKEYERFLSTISK